jgi:excisionase family DNA binding protein
MSPQTTPLAMSLIGAAAHVGLHPNTVRRLALNGTLPFTRYGRKIMIRTSDLAAFQEAQEARTVATIQSLAAGDAASGSD